MDGVFMAKMVKRICLCLTVLIWCTMVIRDRSVLNQELIRFHVVANSDSEEDQNIKRKVRDAVLESIRMDLQKLTDVESAKLYLQENLPKIQKTAKTVLEESGAEDTCLVTLCKEAFDTRKYDTFTLPAGVYESLRIVIGEGAGQNWWCVTFPALCMPAAGENFEAEAVGAGFSRSLCDTLQGDTREIRFFLLDQLGKLENILFTG